jgi:superfamily II DNA or RNA helicase
LLENLGVVNRDEWDGFDLFFFCVGKIMQAKVVTCSRISDFKLKHVPEYVSLEHWNMAVERLHLHVVERTGLLDVNADVLLTAICERLCVDLNLDVSEDIQQLAFDEFGIGYVRRSYSYSGDGRSYVSMSRSNIGGPEICLSDRSCTERPHPRIRLAVFLVLYVLRHTHRLPKTKVRCFLDAFCDTTPNVDARPVDADSFWRVWLTNRFVDKGTSTHMWSASGSQDPDLSASGAMMVLVAKMRISHHNLTHVLAKDILQPGTKVRIDPVNVMFDLFSDWSLNQQILFPTRAIRNAMFSGDVHPDTYEDRKPGWLIEVQAGEVLEVNQFLHYSKVHIFVFPRCGSHFDLFGPRVNITDLKSAVMHNVLNADHSHFEEDCSSGPGQIHKSQLERSGALRVKSFTKLTNNSSKDLSVKLVLPSVLRTPLTVLQHNVLVRVVKVLKEGLLSSVAGAAKSVVNEDNGMVTLFSRATKSLTTITDEKYRELRQMMGCVVAMETGAGKTLLSLILAFMFRRTDVPNIIVPMDNMTGHFVEEMKKHGLWRGDAHTVVIERVSDLVGMSHRVATCRLLIVAKCVIRSKKFLMPKAHLVILDECHALKGQSAQRITNMPIDILIGLTATPSENFSGVKTLFGLDKLQALINCPPSQDLGFIKHCIITGNKLTVAEANRINSAASSSPSSTTETKTSSTSSTTVEVPVPTDIQLSHRTVKPPKYIVDAHRFLDRLDEVVPSMKSNTRLFRLFQRLTSGGNIDVELFTAVIKATINEARVERTQEVSSSHLLFILRSNAPRCAFADSLKDDCSVCLEQLNNPVQLSCGHLLCTACLEAILTLARRRCPHCRTELGSGQPVVYTPSFELPSQTKKKRKSSGNKSKQPKKIIKSAKDVKSSADVRQLIDDTNVEHKNVVNVSGKHTELMKIVDEMIADNKAKKKKVASAEAAATKEEKKNKKKNKNNQRNQLVVFTKIDANASEYIDAMRTKGLLVRQAGVCKTDRTSSMRAIELFKAQKIDVIVMNFAYATGFDMCTASYLVITDFSLKSSSLVQAMGRAARVGQIHAVVKCYVLVYDKCFDHWLFENRTSTANASLNVKSAISLQDFCLSHLPGTLPFQRIVAIRKMYQFIKDEVYCFKLKADKKQWKKNQQKKKKARKEKKKANKANGISDDDDDDDSDDSKNEFKIMAPEVYTFTDVGKPSVQKNCHFYGRGILKDIDGSHLNVYVHHNTHVINTLLTKRRHKFPAHECYDLPTVQEVCKPNGYKRIIEIFSRFEELHGLFATQRDVIL